MPTLTTMVSMRLSKEDQDLLDKVSKSAPVVPRLTLARVALRLGLEAIRKDPHLLLGVKKR